MPGRLAPDRGAPGEAVPPGGVLCHTDDVPLLEPLLTVAGLLSIGVFVLAFKSAVSETCLTRDRGYAPELPRAALRNAGRTTGQRWLRGASKQRILRHVPLFQAGLVAAGITAIFIMFLCMAGVLATLAVGL